MAKAKKEKPSMRSMMAKMRASSGTAPSGANTLEEAPNPIFHQELGEGPVSIQPTEFTQTNDSQLLFSSNPDLNNILGADDNN